MISLFYERKKIQRKQMEKKAVANKEFFLCYTMSHVGTPQAAKNCKNKLVVRGFFPPQNQNPGFFQAFKISGGQMQS